MSKRVEKFESLKSHPWYGRHVAKLDKQEVGLILSFIAEHEHLGANEFELAVNRMFLEKPRSKRFALVQELLSCCAKAA